MTAASVSFPFGIGLEGWISNRGRLNPSPAPRIDRCWMSQCMRTGNRATVDSWPAPAPEMGELDCASEWITRAGVSGLLSGTIIGYAVCGHPAGLPT